MAICAIVIIPVLLWWSRKKIDSKVKWFGYLMIFYFIRGSIELTNTINVTLLRYIFELPIIFLYFKSCKKISYAGRLLIIPFIIISIISAVQTKPIMLILFLLMYLEVFMLLVYFINNYSGVNADLLNKLFWFLACSQIPAAIIKYFLVGIQEPYIGSMSVHEGGITTVFSLVMYCYSLEMYLCTKKRKYLYALIGFVLFGVVGNKRALVFFFPAFYFVVIFIHSRFSYSLIANMKWIIIGAIFMPILFVVLCIFSPTFNPTNKMNHKESFNLDYVINYSKEYNRGDYGGDDDVGRAEATAIVHAKIINADFFHMLFGYGSGVLVPSSFNDEDYSYDAKIQKYGVGYAISIGYLTMLVQTGFIGALLYFMIFFLLLKDLTSKLRIYKSFMTDVEIGKCVSSIIVLICTIFISTIYNATPFTLNCASVLNMWIIAFTYIKIDTVRRRISLN